MVSAIAAPAVTPKRTAEFHLHASNLSGQTPKLFDAAGTIAANLRSAFFGPILSHLKEKGYIYSGAYFHSDTWFDVNSYELRCEIDLKLNLVENREGKSPTVSEQVELLTDAIMPALLPFTRGYDVSGNPTPFFCGRELSLEEFGNSSFPITDYKIALVISEHVG